MRLSILYFLFLFFLVSAAVPVHGLLVPKAYTLPTPEIETLPNGLKVVWFLNDRFPVVDLAVLVQGGFRDDPTGKSGVAELLSSALARGAAGQSAQQLSHSIEVLGAAHYETADEDSFTAGIHGLSPDADQLLELLGKMVTQSDLSDTEVTRERARTLDRWQHIGDYSETMAGLAYRRIMTAGSPYGRGSILSLKELKTVQGQDVRDYYRKFFTPKNSVLMVVGRVDKVQFRKKILAVLGDWKGELPQRPVKSYSDSRFVVSTKSQGKSKAPLQKAAPKIFLMDRPGLNQAQVRLGFLAPSILVPEHHALVVGNALLGEYFNSRLNLLIRDQLGLTYGINSGFSYSRDLSSFTITSSTQNETVGPLIVKTLDVLEQLKRGPISADEVGAAKTYLVGGFPLSTSTLQAVASRWLAGQVLGVQANYLNEYMGKIQNVSNEEVQSAIQKYFNLDQLVIVISGDAGKIRESLGEVKLAPLKTLSASDLRL